jgi:hypothetical protein
MTNTSSTLPDYDALVKQPVPAFKTAGFFHDEQLQSFSRLAPDRLQSYFR